MASSKNRKSKLFSVGVQAYKQYSGEDTGCYCCPICRKKFSSEDLDKNLLTLEHVPPKSQGGKAIALTCSVCNNKAGHTIDAEVARREEVLKASALVTQKGTYEGDLALSFGDESGKPLNFRAVLHDNQLRFYLKPKSNPPDARGRLKACIDRHNSMQPGHVTNITFSTIKKYSKKLSNVGYLKSAFLVAFAAFGYTYAFDANLEDVRRQIILYDKDVLKNYILRPRGIVFEENSFLLVDSPVKAFFVVINNQCVVLPMPFCVSETNVYTALSSCLLSRAFADFGWKALEWPTSLLLRWDLETRL